jgi:hypothetical protein
MVLAMKFEIEKYTADTFVSYVGQVFNFESVDPAGGPVSLQLSEVRRHKSSGSPTGFRDPFALVFTAPAGASFSSALLRLAHDDFEPGEWFVSRVFVAGVDPCVAYYEAVFG